MGDPMRVLCVATQRNEGPFLLEWIAHTLSIGVTDLLIYSNDCDDGSDQMLDLLAQAGVLTHVRHTVPAGTRVQWAVLKSAWAHPLRAVCDWALVCDIDEFINIHAGDGSIPALVGAVHAGTQAIALPWRLFGSNDVLWLQDRPVSEQFTHAMAPECDYPIAATLFKTLFRLDGPFVKFGIHRPRHGKAHPAWVDGSGTPLPDVFINNPDRLSLHGLPRGRALVECNHYSLRSAQSFIIKRDRGLPNRQGKPIDLSYWNERNFNEVEETSIQRMSAATRAMQVRLMAIDGVAELHEKALTWHHARFEELMRKKDIYRLMSMVAVSAGSRTLPPAAAHRLLDYYQKTQLAPHPAAIVPL